MKKEHPNITYIEKLADGDIVFVEKMVNIIRNEFPKEREVYKRNMENGRLEQAAGLVHKLKHKFNIFGLTQGYQLAVVHEECLRSGNGKKNKAFMEVLDTLDFFLKTLSI